jgi:hypothetical protein
MTVRPGGLILASALFLTTTPPSAHAQDSPLKVEIRIKQAFVRNTQDFDVSTKIENTGTGQEILHLSQCSYSTLQWMTDNPSVHVKEIFCKKNRLVDIRLNPGEVYERPLPVRTTLPVSGVPQTIAFRLGFSPRREAGLRASDKGDRVWSNAVTLTVK